MEQEWKHFHIDTAKRWYKVYLENEPSEVLMKLHLLHETACIFSKLAKLTELGFFTVSSQPTPFQSPLTVHPHQRAYVVGYVPRHIRLQLIEKLEGIPDIFLGLKADEIEVSDGDFGKGYNWGGRISDKGLSMLGLDRFPELEPLEIVDMNWERKDTYMFDILINVLHGLQ